MFNRVTGVLTSLADDFLGAGFGHFDPKAIVDSPFLSLAEFKSVRERNIKQFYWNCRRVGKLRVFLLNCSPQFTMPFLK